MAQSVKKRHGDYVGLYGNIRINKRWCTDCEGTAFVIGGNLACCGVPVEGYAPGTYKREVSPEVNRVNPPAAMQRHILQIQNHCCFYCSREFGTWVERRNKKRLKLRLEWDHLVPYSYSQNNSTDNFVAACMRCNQWKGALMFESVEQARVYLLNKWAEQSKDEDEKD